MFGDLLKITRGDTRRFRFKRYDFQGEVVSKPATEVYFTVKKNPDGPKVLQKKLGDGITWNANKNQYEIAIEPNDTSELDFGDYGWDIEVTDDDYVKTIAIGILKIGVEYTSGKDKING